MSQAISSRRAAYPVISTKLGRLGGAIATEILEQAKSEKFGRVLRVLESKEALGLDKLFEMDKLEMLHVKAAAR